MRHLVDLNNKIAVITWWEKNLFPYDKETRYKELYRKKYRWNDLLNESEEMELKGLKTFEGKITIRIESIDIINMLPVESNQISTTFSITGSEYKCINDAIEKLKEPYKDKKILLHEAIEIEEY